MLDGAAASLPFSGFPLVARSMSDKEKGGIVVWEISAKQNKTNYLAL
jgi:hypothetical protein